MANTDLQLNTTITLKDEFSSQMGGFATSVGRLHGMLESLNTTMNKISHIASTPMNNNFSNGLASIGRSAHRANIELTTLNNTLTRTIGLASRTPSGGVTATAGATGGGTRGLGAIRGYRGILGGVTRALSTVNANFFRGLGLVNAGFLRGLESIFSVALRSLGGAGVSGLGGIRGGGIPSSNSPKAFGGFSDLLKNNLVTALVGAFGSMAVIKQAQKLFEDATKQMTVHQRLSHLNFVKNGEIGIDELKDRIFGASMRSKTNYLDFAKMIQTVGARAGGAFGSSGELITFTEQLQKIFTADSEMDASSRISTTVQLSRALLKGQMESRELNQVLYNTPSLIDLIAKTLKKPETEIYKLASDGKITANIVKKAVFDNIDEINKKFLDMPDGWGEVMIRINNYAQHAFQGVYKKITDIFSAERIQKIGEKIAPIFYNLASILERLLDKINPIIDNIINSFDNWFTNLTELTVVLGTVIGLVATLNAVLMVGPVGWILGAVILLEAVIGYLNSIDQTSHTLLGWLTWGFVLLGEYIIDAIRVILNIIVGVFIETFRLIELLIKFIGRIISTFVLGFKLVWITIKSLFFNGMNYIFQGINNLAKGTVNILLDVVNSFLEPLEKGLNSIIELTNKISGTKFQEVRLRMDKNGAIKIFDNFSKALKNDNKQYNNKLAGETNKAYDDYLKSLNKNAKSMKETNDTYNAIEKALWTFRDPLQTANESRDYVESLFSNKNNASNSKSMLNWDKLGTGFDKSSVLNDIKKNTDDIRNNSDFSKYLRELADRNSINHFTSPTYSINLENQNTINSQADYNGFVTRIVDEIKEALLNSPQSIPYGGAYA